MARWGLTEDADWQTRFLSLHQDFGLRGDDLYDCLGVELRALWQVTSEMQTDKKKVFERVLDELEALFLCFPFPKSQTYSTEDVKRSLRVTYNALKMAELRTRTVERRWDWLQNEAVKELRVKLSSSRNWLATAQKTFVPIIEDQLITAGIIQPKTVTGLDSSLRSGPDALMARPGLSETPYVRRAEYHELFALRVSEGYRVILLTGDAGNGKSRLARGIVEESCNDTHGTCIELDAQSPSSLSAAIAGVLVSRGINTFGKDAQQLYLDGVGLVSALGESDFLLLDNAQDWGTISGIIGSTPRATVIVTSSSDVLSGGVRHGVIDVEPMDQSTSQTLIRALLPGACDDDIVMLADALEGKPLAIEQVCAYLSMDELVSTADFLVELQINAAEAMDVPIANAERTLTFTYRRTLDRLRTDHPFAADMLRLIACLGNQRIDIYLHTNAPPTSADMRRHFLDDNCPVLNLPTHKTDIVRSIRVLSRHKLVRVVDDRHVVINWLTQRIINGLIKEDVEGISRSIYPMYAAGFIQADPSDPLPVKLLPLVHHLRQIMMYMGNLYPDLVRDFRIGRVLSILLSGARLIGDAQGRDITVMLWRAVYYNNIAELDEDLLASRLIFMHDRFMDGRVTSWAYMAEIRMFMVNAVSPGLRSWLKLKENAGYNIFAWAELHRSYLLTYDFENFESYIASWWPRVGRVEQMRSPDIFVGWYALGISAMLEAEAARLHSRLDWALWQVVTAHRVFEQDFADVRCKHGMILTAVSAVELCLMGANLPSPVPDELAPLAASYMRSLKEMLGPMYEGAVKIADSRAFDTRAIARIREVQAYAITCDLHKTSTRLAEMEDRRWYDYLEEAIDLNRRAGCSRLNFNIAYEMARTFALYEDSRRHTDAYLNAALASARGIRDGELTDRLELLAVKIRAVENRSVAGDMERCLEIAFRGASLFWSPYRYADALATAAAIGPGLGVASEKVLQIKKLVAQACNYIEVRRDFQPISILERKDFTPVCLLAL